MKILEKLEHLQKAAQEAAVANKSLESLFLRSDFENLGRSALPALIRVARAAEMMDTKPRSYISRALKEALQQLRAVGTDDEGVRDLLQDDLGSKNGGDK